MDRLLSTYLTSLELKKTIVKRSTELEIPFRYICHDINVEYKHFMATYINSEGTGECKLTVKQFEEMLDILGMSTRFQFVVKKDYPASEIREKLKDKYEKYKHRFEPSTNKEKRDTSID